MTQKQKVGLMQGKGRGQGMQVASRSLKGHGTGSPPESQGASPADPLIFPQKTN